MILRSSEIKTNQLNMLFLYYFFCRHKQYFKYPSKYMICDAHSSRRLFTNQFCLFPEAIKAKINSTIRRSHLYFLTLRINFTRFTDTSFLYDWAVQEFSLLSFSAIFVYKVNQHFKWTTQSHKSLNPPTISLFTI